MLKKLIILSVILIFIISINFSFAQENNETTVNSQNNTTTMSQLDTTVKNDVQTIKMNGVTNRFNGVIYYSATFYDGSGNTIKNQSVWFTLDTPNIDYGFNVTTDSQGIAILKISVNKGNHYLTAYNLVTGTNISANFKVFDVVSGKNIKMYESDGTSYKVRVYDDNGKPVKANQKVTFWIHDKKYTRKTDKNGYASFKINLKPGIYYIYATYKDFQIRNQITVNNIIKPLTSFGSKLVRSTIKYKVKYLGKNKKNKKINVKFNKKKYKAITNKKGIATFSLKTPKKLGYYKIVASYSKSKVTSIYSKYQA